MYVQYKKKLLSLPLSHSSKINDQIKRRSVILLTLAQIKWELWNHFLSSAENISHMPVRVELSEITLKSSYCHQLKQVSRGFHFCLSAFASVNPDTVKALQVGF